MTVFLNERQVAWFVVDSRAWLHGFQAQHTHFLTAQHWLLFSLSAPVLSCVKRGKAVFACREIMSLEEVNPEKRKPLMGTSSICLSLPSPYLLGNSILPYLEWLSEKPPLHLHPGKTQPKHCGAGLQALCATSRRRRPDLPAQLHCVRGKTC